MVSNVIGIMCFITTVVQGSKYVLKETSVNSSALSITSFSFRDEPAGPPQWVSRIMGKHAVYWNLTGGQPMFHWSIAQAQANYRRGIKNLDDGGFHIPSATILENLDQFWPQCSIEMLGFARLNTVAPFRGLLDRFDNPSVGTATLTPIQRTISDIRDNTKQVVEKLKPSLKSWNCYYRAMYLNYKNSDPVDSFWAVAFYCPADTEAHLCDSFTKMHSVYTETDTEEAFLTLFLTVSLRKGNTWTLHINTTRAPSPLPPHSFLNTKDHSKQTRNTQSRSAGDIAVCTVWPYTTSNDDKLKVNEAMIFEFLRYYTKLGMRVFVYDPDGNAISRVLASKYARSQSDRATDRDLHHQDRSNIDFGLVEYHDFTISSQLRAGVIDDLSRKHFSDNENATQSTVQMLDREKELTYTHCRFDAKARFDISRVLVVDFDEFLYCKNAGPTAAQQHYYLQHILNAYQIGPSRLEQILLGQTWVMSRARKPHSDSIIDCVNAQIEASEKLNGSASSSMNTAPSIFDCFSSVRKVIYVPYVKSFHLEHVCPYTSMHHACGGCFGAPHHFCSRREQNVRVYECLCKTDTTRHCSLVHLSLVEDNYHGHQEQKYSFKDMLLPSELQAIVKSN